jgi:hypothetical protein
MYRQKTFLTLDFDKAHLTFQTAKNLQPTMEVNSQRIGSKTATLTRLHWHASEIGTNRGQASLHRIWNALATLEEM